MISPPLGFANRYNSHIHKTSNNERAYCIFTQQWRDWKWFSMLHSSWIPSSIFLPILSPCWACFWKVSGHVYYHCLTMLIPAPSSKGWDNTGDIILLSTNTRAPCAWAISAIFWTWSKKGKKITLLRGEPFKNIPY